MNNKRLDLNLFLVIDAVMTEKNVTRAGDALAMSQPAVSNALNRARHLLNDRLFIRSLNGVIPTPYMMTIWPEIHRMIEASKQLVSGHEFDPAATRGKFRISISDSLARRTVPDLIRRVALISPMTCIQVVPHSNAGSARAVEQGSLDCAVGMFPTIPGDLNIKVIAVDEMICIMRRDHALAGKLTPQTFSRAGHVSVTPSGRNQGFVDSALSFFNERRTIAALVSNYWDAIEIIADTDFLACIPRHCISDDMVLQYGIRVEPLPFEVEPIQYKLIWHDRIDLDPSHRWFRGLIHEVVAEAENSKLALPRNLSDDAAASTTFSA